MIKSRKSTEGKKWKLLIVHLSFLKDGFTCNVKKTLQMTETLTCNVPWHNQQTKMFYGSSDFFNSFTLKQWFILLFACFYCFRIRDRPLPFYHTQHLRNEKKTLRPNKILRSIRHSYGYNFTEARLPTVLTVYAITTVQMVFAANFFL